MRDQSTSERRRYNSALRAEKARRTRDRVLAAAASEFSSRGWSGTTLGSVAGRANVSPKTIEALFGTKARLLTASVDFAIRGDAGPKPMPQRDAIAEMEAAPTASAMLRLHAAHMRRVNRRSAAIAAAVEHAAQSDLTVHRLWRRMNRNRAYAVNWAAAVLLTKEGRRHDLSEADAKSGFWVALDWGTYRTLTQHGGLSAKRFEAWLVDFYTRQFLE
jgi:AcrR family transcriptional regulator